MVSFLRRVPCSSQAGVGGCFDPEAPLNKSWPKAVALCVVHSYDLIVVVLLGATSKVNCF